MKKRKNTAVAQISVRFSEKKLSSHPETILIP